MEFSILKNLIKKCKTQQKMTGEEFCELIKKDPSWCLSLKEPIEVTTFVNLKHSSITHLSPLITFSGLNSGWAASFFGCKNLKVATGTFNGFTSFENSGIEKIENLNVTEDSSEGCSATFSCCKNLTEASGNYKGFVNFESSGVTTIKNLNIEEGNLYNKKAAFEDCHIKYVPKQYRGNEFEFDTGVKINSILKDETIKETINKIKKETNNIEI